MRKRSSKIILTIVLFVAVATGVFCAATGTSHRSSFLESIFDFLANKKADNTPPLHKAARRGNLSEIKRLLDSGVQVDAKDPEGRTPLYLAVARDEDEAVEMLLKYGADVDGQNFEAGCTALFGAVLHDSVKSAKSLIKHGADVNFTVSAFPQYPLHYAAAIGNVDVAEVLLANGADVNQRGTRMGMTAVYIATVADDQKMITLLKAHGADTTITDNHGQTPQQAAAIMKHRETHQLVKVPNESTRFDHLAIVQISYLGITQRDFVHRGNRIGFVIGDGSLVVTAAHCVDDFIEDARNGTLVQPQVLSRYYGDIFEAEIIAIDTEADVAILKVVWDKHPAMQLAAMDEVAKAQEILIAAYPPTQDEASEYKHYREVFSERFPVIAFNDANAPDSIVLGGAKFVGPGWSGSPMILPASGKVAGVFARHNLKQVQDKIFLHNLMGCDVSHIRALLERNGIDLAKQDKAAKGERNADAEKTFSLFISCFEALTRKDYALSLSKAKEVVSLRPKSVNARLLLAQIAVITHIECKDEDTIKLAESSYQEALKLAPENFTARAGYGDFLLWNKRNSQALAAMNKAIDLQPNSSFVLSKLIAILNGKDPNQAELYARRLTEKYPGNAKYWFQLSNILAKQRKHDEEVETARTAVSLSKDVPYQHRRRLAHALSNAKLFDQADVNYKLLLDYHQCAPCWFIYAKVLINLGPERHDDAIKAIEKAESMNDEKQVPPESLIELRTALLDPNVRVS